MNWDDLRVFGTVVEQGSIRQAAKTLGVSHATVSRRIRTLEQVLGISLLRRRGTRYEQTEEGRYLLETHNHVQAQILAAQRLLGGRDKRLNGEVRLTLSETFLPTVSRHLSDFSKLHPGIDVNLLTSNATLNLNQRDADIALRVTDSPQDTLVGRHLSDISYTAYGTARCLERHFATSDWNDLRWVGWSDAAQPTLPYLNWMTTNVTHEQIHLRVDSPGAMHSSTAAGAGVGLLPCILGDADPRLQRVPGISLQHGGGLWLLTHRDLRGKPRFRVLLDFLADRLRAERGLFRGISANG